MLTHGLLVVIGLVVLLVAGELLVRGAIGLAKLLGLPPLVIGLTVVAFGTSAPELVVTIQAVISGDNGIAMGNIVGSNIANILLVLGLPAVISSICLSLPKLGRHVTMMLAATAIFCGFVYWGGGIGGLAGIVMLSAIAVYVIATGIDAARHPAEAGAVAETDEIQSVEPSALRTPLFVVFGLAGLPIGADLLVDNGAAMAEALGVRDEIVGLTVVAFGTSLPELATVLAAALKRQADVAVGNIVGSNIFNLLFVGGVAGLVGFSPFSEDALRLDLPVMIGATLVLAMLAYRRATIGRALGFLFFAAYASYIGVLAWGAM